MNRLNYFVTYISLCCLIVSCQESNTIKSASIPTSPLFGSWQMEEIHWITPDTTYSIPTAQPGIFMLNEASYTIIWTPTQEPRIPFDTLAKPTAAEMQAGFRSIVFNSGSYELSDSTLTTTAMVAKVPGFEGGKQFYRYQIEQDQLTLQMFDETYPDGGKPEWYGKVETQFKLKRIAAKRNN
ncbi:MAG: lipocalin-like domain-containing protein [Saprospiraceae bacterium]